MCAFWLCLSSSAPWTPLAEEHLLATAMNVLACHHNSYLDLLGNHTSSNRLLHICLCGCVTEKELIESDDGGKKGFPVMFIGAL